MQRAIVITIFLIVLASLILLASSSGPGSNSRTNLRGDVTHRGVVVGFSGPNMWKRYNGTGLVQDFTNGHRLAEVSVLWNHATSKWQMWGSRAYYEPGRPLLFPSYSAAITGVRIGYAESTDGVHFTFLGDVTPDTYDGEHASSESNYGRSVVRRGPDGMYHMLAAPYGHPPTDGSVTQFDYFTSPTGLPGSWKLIQAGVLVANQPYERDGLGNAGDIVWRDGVVHLFYDVCDVRNIWKIAYASGPDLQHLTKYSGNPIISRAPDSVGDASVVKAGNRYVMAVHEGLNGTLPTQSSYYTNSNLGPTGWTRRGWLLTLTNFSSGPKSKAQIADVWLMGKGGVTHLYWTEQSDQSETPTTLFFGAATIDKSLAQLFGTSPNFRTTNIAQ